MPVPLTYTPPEVELLYACARTQIDENTGARIKALAAGELDWEYIVEAAGVQGIVALVYSNLNTICPEAVPQLYRDQLRARFMTNSSKALQLTAALLKILNVLEANNIPALPYKGPALAAAVYGNVALRQCMDLDILIRKKDVPEAKRLLREHDYYPATARTDAEEARFLKSRVNYNDTLLHSASNIQLELHWGFSAWYFPFPFDLSTLWSRVEKAHVAGREVAHFPPEDLLLILAVHGAKHRWRYLKWICDIAELVRMHGHRLNWERALKTARKLGCARIVLLGLCLAGDLLGVDLPPPVQRAIAAEASLRELTDLTRKVMFPEVYGPLKNTEPTQFYLNMWERPTDRLRFLMYLFLREKEEDAPQRGSRRLSLLNRLLRPARGVRQHGLGWVKQLVGVRADAKPAPAELEASPARPAEDRDDVPALVVSSLEDERPALK